MANRFAPVLSVGPDSESSDRCTGGVRCVVGFQGDGIEAACEVPQFIDRCASFVTPVAVEKDKAIQLRRQGRAQPSTPEALNPSALSRSTLDGPQPRWHTLGSEDTG
jgi:hypothetical protein